MTSETVTIREGFHTVTPYLIVHDATAVLPLEDQEYGERSGGFRDPFGHVWYLATPLATGAPS